MKRKLLALAGSVALGAGLLVGASSPAMAAGCAGKHLDNWPITGGYISVYYDSSTGRNCALTYTNKPGTSQHIGVWLSANGGGSTKQVGTFKYYAGPVSVYGKGKCINFSGQVGNGAIEGVVNAYCGSIAKRTTG
ncbi:hypothetical protein ABT294_16980 [Nonomuraea sp. NPDC000554]|uniref:hypothetical protein n=1 Tax=Nonomuraea sp. NPDC000554 TaxID=3154259 RepID=UPI00333027BC